MAEVSKQDVDLLKNYMSETNQGIKTLIELRKQEDTPRSLLAGNAFEIGAQVTLAKKREGFDTKEGMIEVDNRVVIHCRAAMHRATDCQVLNDPTPLESYHLNKTDNDYAHAASPDT